MDLSNPHVWKDGIGTVLGAPHIVFPLLFLVAGAVWWFRGTIERGAKEGLTIQIALLNERLSLAQDQQADVARKLEVATSQVIALQAKATQMPPQPITVQATSSAVDALQIATDANRFLHRILRAEPGNYTVTSGSDTPLALREDKPK
jgi:hypothetical protein